MDLLLFVLSGIFVGVLARMIVPGREAGGFVPSIVVGILGALLGGLLGRALGMYAAGQPEGLFMSLGGAVLLLFGYHAAAFRRVV